MPSLVEIQYDPYVPRLNILLNGKQPPDFSPLVQYMDEDIWCCCDQILDAIFSEVRDDYYIEFTGTSEITELLRFACKKNTHCLAFREKSFTINDTLQKRLGKLNQFIKKNAIVNYKKTIVDAFFIVPQRMQAYLDDILSIDVSNLFCAVRIETTMGNLSAFEEGEDTFIFSITEDFENGLKLISNKNHINPAFSICIGRHNRFCGISNNTLMYETTEDGLIDAIFQCLLTVPLLIAFRHTVESLPISYKQSDDFLSISHVEPEVIISVPARVEAGKSIPIKVSLKPLIGTVPNLDYHLINCAVAECDGLSIFGKQQGRTTLEAYHYGEKKPFFSQDIDVFTRNRIKKIILSHDEVTLGVGDSYLLHNEYVPEDADNADSIIWKSTNEGIVKVDSNGRINAISSGVCRVICSAENTSAGCVCDIKPYLSEIQTEIEGNSLLLRPTQEFKVKYSLVPANCFDSDIELISSNYDIVNIVGETLCAKNEGFATVTIRNTSHRKSLMISVTVEKEKVKKKKKSFFYSLFGN